jgi:hypothetical protein
MNVLVSLIWLPAVGAGEETSLAFRQKLSFSFLFSAVFPFASSTLPSLDGWCLRAFHYLVVAGVQSPEVVLD